MTTVTALLNAYNFNGTDFDEGPIISIGGLVIDPTTNSESSNDGIIMNTSHSLESGESLTRGFFSSGIEQFNNLCEPLKDELVGLAATFHKYLSKSFATSLR